VAARLPRAFYARPAHHVAPDLLGKLLTHRFEGEILSGRIVEVEAYGGQSDPGSHAFRGSTSRNRVMFGPPGYTYVYVSYGMHVCMNVVTDADGVAGAVLIRALEPARGIETQIRLRGGRPLRDLCSGPGKLCQALGITMADYGQDLCGERLFIEDDGTRISDVSVSTRVGLSAGGDSLLRWYVTGNPFVSRGRPTLPRLVN
jgi:DNA-3-methyladenine glycosylase